MGITSMRTFGDGRRFPGRLAVVVRVGRLLVFLFWGVQWWNAVGGGLGCLCGVWGGLVLCERAVDAPVKTAHWI